MAKGKHGGARPNSGPKKGTKYAPTIRKEEAREVARALITAQLEPMIQAQITHAKGLSYLVARHKTTGKFAKLTQELAEGIAAGQNPEYEAIEVWSKDPSVQAFTDLLNRALDKPAEQIKAEVKHDGKLEIVIKKPW